MVVDWVVWLLGGGLGGGGASLYPPLPELSGRGEPQP